MGMMYGLADWIRSMGVEVVEIDGWQDRGHGVPDPTVFVYHHTADGPNGISPSLNICINGAPYTAPGPLCNVLQSREWGEGNDRAFVIAAGTSYNAGTGGWNGVSGNNRTCGLEIEHTGTEPLPQHRVETACKIGAGVLRALGHQDGRNSCHHWEWSYPPGSKIDVCCNGGPGGKCSGAYWRDLTTQYIQSGAPAPVKQNFAKGTNAMVVEITDQQGEYRFVWADSYADIDRDDAFSLIFGAGGFPDGRALPHVKWNSLKFVQMQQRFGWQKVKD